MTRATYVREGNVPLIQWRAVFGGVVIGLAIMLMLTSLWLALGLGSGMENVTANLDWYLAGSGIFAMLFAGYLAGWLSGIRGFSAGLVNGMAVWALVLIGGLLIATPVLGVLGFQQTATIEGAAQATIATQAVWPVFWSLVIGFGAAVLGGFLGGISPRAAAPEIEVVEREDDHEHQDDDRPRRTRRRTTVS